MNLHQSQTEPLVLSGRDVTAVLGPTNTGKTHLAIERMVAHESGVIGLPLRLLAREVYARVCDKVGTAKTALITGEEKIVPAGAKYFVCTVEAMPRETDLAFAAIDEVQLANDLERGHTFTDRILHLRGRHETLLLGAATMRGILEKLLKGIAVVTRPRLSHLAYAGSKKITRLPHRSAIVAFSADEVYAIAELIRRQRGGAAVVLGALSPRTRNAQVEIYQNGDVDFLVATDAIGMGLNLDVDHVAFAQNRKFDGYQYRELSAAELGQIAGRAGRHVRDGTFGVTGQVDPFADDLVQKIEGHDFEPVRVLQWRTAHFDFASLEALKRSIETPAPVEGLTRALPAVDAQALERLSQDPELRDLATTRERVALLWEACAVPDYRKIAPAQHADLIASMYVDLVRRGHVDETYMAEQVRRADSTEGDIDTLSARIAQIRTWTFVSNRPGWLADPAHWQEKTREIEDKLSDALHDRLTKRFVDRRTSVLMRRLRENSMPEAEISPAGAVLVEGHHVGELQGFRFTADQSAGGEDARAVKAAAQKALAAEFETRADRFAVAANGDLALASDGMLRWIGAPVATLAAGEDALKPRVILLADEQLTGPARDKVAARAERYVNFQIETLLKPLVDLKNAEQISGIAKGIAFRLVENFGLLNRRDITEEVRSLEQEGRAALRRLGVRFGAYHLFVPTLLKPAPAGLVTLLWALKNDGKEKPGFGDVVQALASGRTSVVVDPAFDKEFYKLAGFRVLGRRAVRVDILERLADLIRPALAWNPGLVSRPDGAYGGAFVVTPPMMSILGATADDMEEILKGLGYRGEPKPAAGVKGRLAELDAAVLRAQEEAAAKAAAEKAAAEAQADAAAAEAQAEAAAAEIVTPEAVEGLTDAAVETAEPAAADEPVETTEAPAEIAEAVEVPAEAAAAVEAEAAEAVETEAAAPAAEAAPEAPSGVVEAEAAPEQPAEAAPAEAEPAEEPKPIIIWRTARFENRQRQGQRDRRPRVDRQRGQAAPAEAAANSTAPAEGRREGEGAPRWRREKSGDAKQGKRFEGKERGERPQRGDGPPRGDRRPNDERPDRKDRPERRDGDQRKGPPRDRQAFQAKPPREERAKPFDPDSPFAKLAALRDQLKK
jgi:ATP-dependent RNA helicase SUPV3L1/SUV3